MIIYVIVTNVVQQLVNCYDHMSALQIKNTSKSDPCSSNVSSDLFVERDRLSEDSLEKDCCW